MGATSRKGRKIKKQIPINLKLVFPAKVKNLKNIRELSIVKYGHSNNRKIFQIYEKQETYL